MCLTLRLFKRKRLMEETLDSVDLEKGSVILDYGSGPGYWSAMAAEMIGPSGTVYAADCVPLAANYVVRNASRKGLDNVHPITTDRGTGLVGGSVDLVLLFDTLHML
jgi:protein-L-isoaspartate O-methyltransferase